MKMMILLLFLLPARRGYAQEEQAEKAMQSAMD